MKSIEQNIRSLIKQHLLAEQGLSFSSDDFKDVYATARMAHMGQMRRDGKEYFSHPSEVRNIVRRFYPKDYVSQMAALLHDSLEDAPGLTVDSVEEMEGFIRGSISNPDVGDEVLRVVRAVTHEKGGDYASYVQNLLGDEKALRVKLADMYHNLSSTPSPKQKLKYKNALDLMSKSTGGSTPRGISADHWATLNKLTESKNMRISERNLRKIIRESLEEVENTCWDGYRPGAKTGKKTKKGKSGKRVPNCEKISEGTLYVQRGTYGMSVEDDDDNYVSIGDMILALLESGDDDFFKAPQGVDPKSLATLNQKHEEGVQGGMQRWDPDVFEQYYNVDNERVLRLYARLTDSKIVDLDEDGLTAEQRQELDDDAASELEAMAYYS